MSIFVAWIVYPLVLLALSIGLGLLVDALCGRRLPGALIAPVGFAAAIVVGQFTTLSDGTAELTVPALLLLAAIGVAFSLPWRFGRPDLWPAAAAVGVFAVFAAPVVLTGEPTFAGYIKLDDTATWLALTDRVMEHGRSLEGLEASTYLATLEANLSAGYPVGVFIPFGAAQELVGGDLAWVFHPYQAFMVAMLALSLWEIFGGIVPRPRLRAFAAFVAAQPTLLFGYALWGGVKEVAIAALVALAAALAPGVLQGPGGRRSAIALAVAAGAIVGVLSIGGLVWVAPMLLVLGALALRNLGRRGGILSALAFALALAVVIAPTLIDGGFSPFQSTLTKESELGNLIGSLNGFQVMGIWPAGDFRTDPDGTLITVVLIAFAIFAAAIGLWAAWSRERVAPLLYAASLLACAAVVLVASPWVGGKALAVAAPAALSLAVLGAVATLSIDRLAGAVLTVLVAGGVLWSNVLAYGGADIAPYDQLVELQEIGEEFAGQGPALMTEHNPYGARHFLREVDGESASELRVRPVYLRDGGTAEKGEGVDVDEIALESLFEYPILVLRRSPVRSRPPSPYRLVYSGDYYEAWQRPAAPSSGLPPEHLPLGDDSDPSAVPDCSEVNGLGLLALNNGAQYVRMLGAYHSPVIDATSGALSVPRAATYEAWLKGSVRGHVELAVDDEVIGEARHFLNNDGGFIFLGEAKLDRGRHGAELHFDGPDLHPGSGGYREAVGPLLFTPVGEETGEIVAVDIDDAEQLCGRRWDWIEALQP